MTEAGSVGGQWPWGWGRPGWGLWGWGVDERWAGASVGGEEARALEGGPPGAQLWSAAQPCQGSAAQGHWAKLRAQPLLPGILLLP